MEHLRDSKVRDAHCDLHGPFLARHMFRDRFTLCPACIDADLARKDAEAKAARQAEFVAAATLHSGLRGRFRETTFANFTATTQDQRHAMMTCQDFAASAEGGNWASLTLIGPPGTGKTHLGAAIALETIQRGRRASYSTFRDLIRTLRGTWRRGADETEEQVVEGFASVPMLVIDELGVSFGTDAESAQLFDVIDRRYQLCNPLVLISNLSVPDLRVVLGDRLFDRVREGSQVVTCNWESHRGAP